MEFQSGLTGPILPPKQNTLPTPSNSEESVIQPGTTLPALPPPIEGTLTLTEAEPTARGGYGDVHKGSWSPPGRNTIPVAIKCIRGIKENDRSSEIVIRRIKRETAIWRAAEHPNVLPFYGYQIIDGKPMLVSPWFENGNLYSYLKAHPGVTDVQRLTLLRGAARGLAHLHSLDPPICHGDIKPQNLIVNDRLEALWCDFGISRIMTSVVGTGMTTLGAATGTHGYQAKELFEQDPRITDKSDIYAFGGLILATMTGKPPFYKSLANPNLIVIFVYTEKTPDPSDYPELPAADPLWDLMRQCWSPDTSNRPSMVKILAKLEAEIQSRDRPPHQS